MAGQVGETARVSPTCPNRQRVTETIAVVDMYVAVVPGCAELILDPAEVHEADWVRIEEAEERFASGQMATPWVDRLRALWPGTRSAALSAVSG